MMEYKSILVKNNTQDCEAAIYFYHRYDPVCLLSSSSKFVSAGSSYLHRCEDNFKFKIQTINQKCKKVVVGPRKWVQDTHFDISGKETVIESNLDDHTLEKTMCIRKINVSKETSLDEGRNLYEILKLDFKEIRKLDKEKQDQEIKKAYHREIRRWHSDTAGELGDDEMAHEVVAAYEILKNHERRAEYHNKADFTEGWLSTARWRSILWPECDTEEQIWRYRKRIALLFMSLGISICGVASGTLMAACLGGGAQSLMRTINRKSIEKGCNFEDWAKSLGIGFIAGAITGATGAEITNGGATIVRNASLASGGGAVFSIAADAEKKFVDGVDVTLNEVLWHAGTGAIIGGGTATAVGAVANVSSTNIAGQMAPSLRGSISLKKMTKFVLTNKASESVLGFTAGLLEERLDDNKENRPMGEHVTNLGKQFVGNALLDVGIGVLSSTVSHITNKKNDGVRLNVDRAERRSHTEKIYGSSESAHSSSIMSSNAGIKTNLSSSDRITRSISSNKRFLSASSSKRTFSTSFIRISYSTSSTKRNHSLSSMRGIQSSSFDRITHSASLNKRNHSLRFMRGTHSSSSDKITHSASLNKRNYSLRSMRSTHSSSSDRITHSASLNKRNHSLRSMRGTHSSSSDRKTHLANSDEVTHVSSTDRIKHAANSDRCTHAPSTDIITIADCFDSSTSSDKDTNVGNSCSHSDSFLTDSECRNLDQEPWLEWDKYTVKAKNNPPGPSTKIPYVTTLSDLPVQLECVSATYARFKYLSNKWFTQMIVEFKMNGDVHVKKTTRSGSAIKVPIDAKEVKVYFQVMRFFKMWYDVKKWNRFENKWHGEPHKFRYETPPEQRVFTLGGSLFYEGVIKVTDERHDDVKDM